MCWHLASFAFVFAFDISMCNGNVVLWHFFLLERLRFGLNSLPDPRHSFSC